MKPIQSIEIWAWGKRVGAVAEDPRLGCFAFAYDRQWKREGIELSPQMLPLTDPRPVFTFQNLPRATFLGLPPMLADALPDDFGNALIDAWMSGHGVNKAEISPLDRLSYMNRRSMGALEFKPARGSRKQSAVPLRLSSLVEEARKAVRGTLSADRETRAALENIIRVGTSAGGARAKAVIAWNPQTDEIRCGQFEAAEGFEHWLLKFDGIGPDQALGTTQDYGKIEYAYSLMARQAGIHMYPCRLLKENGRAHFMTKRFDREVVDGVTVKHHIQTLCAMEGLDYKQRATHAYSQLFMAISRMGLGPGAAEQCFLRMAFNVMSRNLDDHTKNFSFRLGQGEEWELAPAYDVTHAYNPSGKWTYQHLMSIHDKFIGITRDDLLFEADRFGVHYPVDLLANVRAALDNWAQYAQAAELEPAIAGRVAADFCLI